MIYLLFSSELRLVELEVEWRRAGGGGDEGRGVVVGSNDGPLRLWDVLFHDF